MCQTWCKILSVYFLIESDSNYLRERVSCHKIEAKKTKNKNQKTSPSVALKLTLSSP